MRHIQTAALLLAALLPSAALPADGDVLAEDFEEGYLASRWTFYDGAEFPGAAGAFERVPDAAHAGKNGGRLFFDFTGGGNYVCAILQLEHAPEQAAVRFWALNPGGNTLVFRYNDQTGQTHQKRLAVPKGEWSDVTVAMEDWQAHYGGANDGRIHGAPRWIAILMENGGAKQGHLCLDDVRLVPGQPVATETADYPAFRFAPTERWSLQGGDRAGENRLDGGKLSYHFTPGIRRLVVAPPEQSLLGRPVAFRVRLRGQAPGQTLRLQLSTHFMAFERTLGEVAGAGEHEYVVPAPPGEGWRFFDGENDGLLHGPLRVYGLLLDPGKPDGRGELEFEEIGIKAEYPANRACVLVAEHRASDGKFVAVVRSLLPRPADGTLAWTLRDWDGTVVGRGTRDVRVPAAAAPLEMVVDAPPESDAATREFAEADFTLTIAGQKTLRAAACRVAPLAAGGSATRDPASPFGMGLYLYRFQNDPQGLAEMDRAAELAARAGVKWTREEFNWARIERRKGQCDWTFYDRMVATAAKHGISVYGLLAYWADWTKPYTQEGQDDYCRFAASAAERYRDSVRHWEVWNEPNIFFWQGPKDQYVQLLKQAHAAIRQASPGAQVLGCSVAGVDTDFIKRTVQQGGPFDVLTIHPYRAELNDAAFVDDLRQTAALVRPVDGPARPVWITEMGWPTPAENPWIGQDLQPASLRRQAELLVRSYVDALASGVCPNISWYDFRNDGDDPFNAEFNMGIATHDFRPKPAYRAFATLTRLLSGKRCSGRIEAGRDVVAFRFAGKEGTTIALWNPSGELHAVLPLAGKAVRVNLMGASRALEVRDGQATVTAAAGQPVFVVLEP